MAHIRKSMTRVPSDGLARLVLLLMALIGAVLIADRYFR